MTSIAYAASVLLLLIAAVTAWVVFTESGAVAFNKLLRRDKKAITDLTEADRLSTASELGAKKSRKLRDPYCIGLGYYINPQNASKVRRNPESSGSLIESERGLPTTVFGPSGSGKTSTILSGAMLEWGNGKGNILCATVKYDLIKTTYQCRKKLGKVHIFDPTGNTPRKYKAMLTAWTPLASARTWKGAMLTAGAMVFASDSGGTNDFWEVQTQSLLAALMFLEVQKPGSSMADVSKLLGSLENIELEGEGEPKSKEEKEEKPDGFSMLRGRLNSYLAEAKAALADVRREAAAGNMSAVESSKRIREAEERLDEFEACWETLMPVLTIAKDAPQTIGGVIAGVSNALVVYRLARAQSRIPWDSPEVFNIDKFISSNDTLYVVAPPRHQSQYAPILSAFAAMVLDQAFEVAQESEEGALETPLLTVLDEIHAIPVQDLAAIYSTARSYNITMLVATQNYSQLCEKYGENGAATLLDNSGTIVVLPRCKDKKTLEVLSAISGEVRVKSESKTVSKSDTKGDTEGGKSSGKSESVTESWETKPLLPPGRISSFTDGEGFAIVGSKRCQLLLRSWYSTSYLTALAEGNFKGSLLEEMGGSVAEDAEVPGMPGSVANFNNPVNAEPGNQRKRGLWGPTRRGGAREVTGSPKE